MHTSTFQLLQALPGPQHSALIPAKGRRTQLLRFATWKSLKQHVVCTLYKQDGGAEH
jgi:hypothetical protein